MHRLKRNFSFFYVKKALLFFSLSLFLSFLSFPCGNIKSSIPVASAKIFGDFSIADEKALGKEFEVLVKSRLPIVEDPVIKMYVTNLMHSLLEKLPPQPFTYEANVVYSKNLNAFASPGGFIFIFTGLLVALENEAQLAGIMAHEIAHVTQRHIASRMDKNKYITLSTLAGMLVGALAGGGDTSSAVITGSLAVGQAAQLNYSRVDENDADTFGLRYLMDANYNPQGLIEAFTIMQNQSFGMGSDFPTYLSTHPDIDSRIANVRSYLKTIPKNKQFRPNINSAFLRAKILTMAYYADTRTANTYFNTQIKEAKDKEYIALSSMGLGILALKQHRRDEAETFFKKALQLAPNDALILREAGKFYFEKTDVKQAETYLEKALSIAPDDYFTLFYKARLLDLQKKYELAHKIYKDVLFYVPENSQVYTYYGRSLGRSGKEFEGYIALAYASLYENNMLKAKDWLKKAKNSQKKLSKDDEAMLKKVENALAYREKMLKKKK